MRIFLNYKYLILILTTFLILSTPLTMVNADIAAADSDVAIIDTIVSSSAPDNNYGSNTFLDIHEANDIFSVMYFDVSHFSGITEAIVKIYVTGLIGIDVNVNIHIITANWTESTLTWNNFGGAYNANVNSSIGPINALNTWYSADITLLAQAWHSGEITNYGILLETDTAGAWVGPQSSENANGPTLDVTYDSWVSEFSNSLMISILITTFIGLLVVRRKKR